jgi:hypothetical protein
MMEALISTETSVLTRTTRRNITEDSILHSHRRENLKSYKYCSVRNNYKVPRNISFQTIFPIQARRDRKNRNQFYWERYEAKRDEIGRIWDPVGNIKIVQRI